MLEIEFEGKIYKFRFGFGFLKEINKKYKEMPTMGVTIPTGFKWTYLSMVDGNMDALEDILLAANKTESPRMSEKTLEAYLDDESTDVDELVELVKGFLSRSNACKNLVNQMQKKIQEAQIQALPKK